MNAGILTAALHVFSWSERRLLVLTEITEKPEQARKTVRKDTERYAKPPNYKYDATEARRPKPPYDKARERHAQGDCGYPQALSTFLLHNSGHFRTSQTDLGRLLDSTRFRCPTYVPFILEHGANWWVCSGGCVCY